MLAAELIEVQKAKFPVFKMDDFLSELKDLFIGGFSYINLEKGVDLDVNGLSYVIMPGDEDVLIPLPYLNQVLAELVVQGFFIYVIEESSYIVSLYPRHDLAANRITDIEQVSF